MKKKTANSFSNGVVDVWNSLLESVVQAPSLKFLKSTKLSIFPVKLPEFKRSLKEAVKPDFVVDYKSKSSK